MMNKQAEQIQAFILEKYLGWRFERKRLYYLSSKIESCNIIPYFAFAMRSNICNLHTEIINPDYERESCNGSHRAVCFRGFLLPAGGINE